MSVASVCTNVITTPTASTYLAATNADVMKVMKVMATTASALKVSRYNHGLKNELENFWNMLN